MKEIINYGEAKRQQILKGVVNIPETEEVEIEKARHGVYTDNAQNRRLQRVGQEYGHAAKEKDPAAEGGESGVPGGNVSLQNHARSASEEALVKVANDPSADAEMRKVATAELERRGVNVRAKNKKGDASLRNGLADGDAKATASFESMGFRQMDDQDLEQYAGVEDASHAFIKQVGGDEDGFETAINNLIDNKGQAKAIKDIAAAMKAVDSADANQSDLDDDEIAEEIENMFDEAGIDISKKGQAVLDKMREEANADADVDDAGAYVDSFNDMAENNVDFDAKGFKSFVKEKGDVRAIKALARYMRENPVDTGGVESEPGDDELAEEIENMFAEAGVKISKKGRKELDAMMADEDDE